MLISVSDHQYLRVSTSIHLHFQQEESWSVQVRRVTMGLKTAIKWPKQITPALVQKLILRERDIQKAVIIFDSATAEYANGFRHDQNTFSIMISKLASANQFRSAEDLLDRMKKEKCNLTEDIFLSVCRAYGRVHRPLDSLRIFHKMKDLQCERTKKSYVTVFSILVSENQLKVAQKFHRDMKEEGISPNVAFLNVLIKALSMNKSTIDAALAVFKEMPDKGHIPDSYTYGTLISGLCKLGMIDEAKRLFKDMETKGCSPTVITYTCLIHSLCRSSNLGEAMKLLKEMGSKGIEPNVVTFSSLMDGLCKGGRSSEALELLANMIAKCLTPNVITYSSLINGLLKEGKLQEAVEILDRMKLQGLRPNVGLYGNLVTCLCECSKFREAANFLDEMVLGKVSPGCVTWSLHIKMHNMVVQGLCEKDLGRAFQVYLSMRTRGILRNQSTYSSLVACFCSTGDAQKAYRVIHEMVLDGFVPDEVTWNAIVSGFLCRKKVHEAAELVQLELVGEFLKPVV
ncbi:pentatricopeptide repeat-containing protein At5g46100-like isoform X2 [Papaver somniferum]|uniref:pentatricopeptide repeat-containing protein At5g46100-like isoform X2 n=1 Tax=Papaver somniferum TaxID=3469 RepID=UPI000E700DB5|nr:pentatricopeptide repeat-containing protein At5g46100-like isoform X2 [Papaver somniferum]